MSTGPTPKERAGTFSAFAFLVFAFLVVIPAGNLLSVRTTAGLRGGKQEQGTV
jgi:hypothetical protein